MMLWGLVHMGKYLRDGMKISLHYKCITKFPAQIQNIFKNMWLNNWFGVGGYTGKMAKQFIFLRISFK